MMITTTPGFPGREISEVLGVVTGNTVRARHLGKDIMAALKHLVGGEIIQYSTLMTEARQQALDRMIEEAKKLKSDAVVNMRFATADVMQGSSEILAYGTAVKLK
jgi:uncharacterized protein YbjQ (UPF0145 family)